MRILGFIICLLVITSCGQGEKNNTADTTKQAPVEQKQALQQKQPEKKATSIRNAVTDDKGVKKFTMKDPNQNKAVPSAQKQQVVRKAKPALSGKTTLPDPCSLMDTEVIADLMDVPAKSININDGTGGNGLKSRACFFKWDEPSIKNAGAMVNVQLNPVEEEAPDYFTYFIDSKIQTGEKDFNTDKPLKFKRWNHVGTSGAYSNEAGKYFWRVGNEYCFMIAFNTEKSEREREKAAEILSKHVMKKMGL